MDVLNNGWNELLISVTVGMNNPSFAKVPLFRYNSSGSDFSLEDIILIKHFCAMFLFHSLWKITDF